MSEENLPLGSKFATRASDDGRKPHIARLNDAITKAHGLQEALDARGIDLTDDKTPVYIFGYGSLPNQPHYHSGDIKSASASFEVIDGLAAGYKRDFSVACSRSGTNTNPGIVYGLDRDADSVQYGGVLSYQGLSLEEKAENLTKFIDRESMEVNGHQVYRFDIIDVEVEGGQTRPCLVCIADEAAPGYRGNLSYDDKVEVIATTHNAVVEEGKPPTEVHPDSTVKDKRNVQASYGYFQQFAVMPIAERIGRPAPTTDFAARCDAAIEAEDRHIETMCDDIERYRETQLTPAEHLFMLQAELKDTDWFKDFGDDETHKEQMRLRIATLTEKIATLERDMSVSPPPPHGHDVDGDNLDNAPGF